MAGWAIPGARRRRLALGVVVALALLVVVGRLQQGGLVSHRPAPALAPPATVARPLPVTATIRLGAAAPQFAEGAQLVAGEGRLWAVLAGTLVGVDPRRPDAVARIRLGGPDDFVSLLAVGAGAVWVATGAGGTRPSVVRVDPATTKVAATLTLPNDNWPWAAGAGSLWSVGCAGEGGPCRLLRLDPRDLHATARFPLPGVRVLPQSLAVGPGSLAVGDDVWLLDQSGGWVWRVDLTGGRVARVRLPPAATPAATPADGPSQLVVGEGAVWVLTSVESPTRLGVRVDAGLVRIDPHTSRVSATTSLANLGGETNQVQLAVGAGGVWVEGLQPQDGLPRAVIDRVDPASGRLRGTIDTGDLSPAALAAGFGAVWLLRPAAGVLLRLDPAAM
jgi:hypothetical protein